MTCARLISLFQVSRNPVPDNRRIELIIAEDGNTDGSTERVREYEDSYNRIHLLHSDERLGRGKALTGRFIGQKKIVCHSDV